MFRFHYKIICLSFGSRVWAGPEPETCGPGRVGPGLGQTLTVWVGPGPGLGLNSNLRAWVGLGLTNVCGPEPGLDSNC